MRIEKATQLKWQEGIGRRARKSIHQIKCTKSHTEPFNVNVYEIDNSVNRSV